MRRWRGPSGVAVIAVLLVPSCTTASPETVTPAREEVEEAEAVEAVEEVEEAEEVEEPDGPDEPDGASAEGPAATDEEPESEATTPPDGSGQGAVADLEDGRHPAYLVGLDGVGRTVTFDVIQFLSGDEAIAAYREDTPEDPEGDPPNDYHLRNVNPALRTLPVADGVTVTVVRLGEPSGAEPVASSFEALPDHLAASPAPSGRLAWNPYWLTVEKGQVVAIDEQYLP